MEEHLDEVYALEQAIVEANYNLAEIRKSQLESLVDTKVPVDFISSRVTIGISPQEIKKVEAETFRMLGFGCCSIHTTNYLLRFDLKDVELVRNFDRYIYIRVKDARLIGIDDSMAE